MWLAWARDRPCWPVVDPQQPTVIGPYVIEARLGRGGFGAVYRALDRRTGERVALKVLHAEVARDPDLLERFLREARTTSAADNPHVVRVVDAHDSLDGFACIAFELLEGETLEARLRRDGALAPEQAVDFAVQILDGLEIAHERGIIHRDIKPANLYLVHDEMRTPCIKILDFGIGRASIDATRKLTETGSSMGSPFYTAPEQLLDAGSVDLRADLYSVGVTLYRMLSGRLPHGAGPPTEWLSFVAQGRTPPPVDSPYGALPLPLVDAVAYALAPRPERRWQNASAFGNALLDSLPGASAPTRVSWEPQAVMRAHAPPAFVARHSPAPAPAPAPAARPALASPPHRASEAVRPFVAPPAVEARPPARAVPAVVAARDAGTDRERRTRALAVALAVVIALLFVTLAAGGLGLAFVAGELSARGAPLFARP